MNLLQLLSRLIPLCWPRGGIRGIVANFSESKHVRKELTLFEYFHTSPGACNAEYLWYKEKVFSGQQFLIPRFLVAIENQRDLLKHNFSSEDLAAQTSQNGAIFEYAKE
jgi:hypothetical protein